MAAVDATGRLGRSGTFRTDDDIDGWLSLHAPGEIDVVAVDAPLIVGNPTVARACERAVTAAYGRLDAGATSATPARLT
ncbi:DUF429 domain-containing protein [Ornithinimicrobium cryptoxanthini]|uniref:DUF429 domain-containing protein n=1 Tax=Ornithinimicrobium cryptoxanthini TaxID=2934161 RepID=UPI00351C1E56